MTVYRPAEFTADIIQFDSAAARARVRPRDERKVATMAVLGAFALIAGLLVGLSVYHGERAHRAATTDADRALAACAGVYDGPACRCAVRAMALPDSPPPARPDERAGAAGASYPAAARVALRGPRDLAQLVQSCLARAGDAPTD